MARWRSGESKLIDNEWRAEMADWAEKMAAARRRYRERETIEATEAAKRPRWKRPADSIHYSGMPAGEVRRYQEAQREREAADV